MSAAGEVDWEASFKPPEVSVVNDTASDGSPSPTPRSPLGSPDLPFSDDEYVSAEEGGQQPTRKASLYFDAVDRSELIDRSATSSPAIFTHEQMVAKMTSLVDFYFGDENFAKDRFLRTKSRESEDGWIALTLILSFKRVRKYTDDLGTLLAGVRKSTVVMLNEEESCVKRCHPLPVSDRERLYNSAVLEHLPGTATDETAIAEICAAAAAKARGGSNGAAAGAAASPATTPVGGHLAMPGAAATTAAAAVPAEGSPRTPRASAAAAAAAAATSPPCGVSPSPSPGAVPRPPTRIRILATQAEFDAVLATVLNEQAKSKVSVHPVFGKHSPQAAAPLPVILAEFESPLACKLGCAALEASGGDWRASVSAMPVCRKEKRQRRRRKADGEHGELYSDYSGDSSAMSDTDMPWARSPALGRSPLGELGRGPSPLPRAMSPRSSPRSSPAPRRSARPGRGGGGGGGGLEPRAEWRARSASPSWRSRDGASESPAAVRRSPGLHRRAITDSPGVVRQPRGPDGSVGFGRGRGRPLAKSTPPPG